MIEEILGIVRPPHVQFFMYVLKLGPIDVTFLLVLESLTDAVATVGRIPLDRLKLFTGLSSMTPLFTVKGKSKLMLFGPTYVGPVTETIVGKPAGTAAGNIRGCTGTLLLVLLMFYIYYLYNKASKP